MRSLRRSRAAVGMAACSLILTMLGPYWTSAANAEVSKQHLEQIIAELGQLHSTGQSAAAAS